MGPVQLGHAEPPAVAAAPGKSSFQDFSFTADISKASPLLFLSCANGTAHQGRPDHDPRAPASSQHEYYTVKLTDVPGLRSTTRPAAPTGDRPAWTSSPSATTGSTSSYRTAEAGRRLDAPVEARWDVKAG